MTELEKNSKEKITGKPDPLSARPSLLLTLFATMIMVGIFVNKAEQITGEYIAESQSQIDRLMIEE